MGSNSDDSDCSLGDGDFADDVIAELVAKSGEDVGRRRSRAQVDKELEDYLQSGQVMADMVADGGGKVLPGQVAELGALASGLQDVARASDASGAGLPEQLRGLDIDLGHSSNRARDRDADTAANATLRKLSQWNGGAIVEAEDTQKESGTKSGVIQNFGESISRVQCKLKAVQQQFNKASDAHGGALDGMSPGDMHGF